MPLIVSFQNIDLGLGATCNGPKLDATTFGAKIGAVDLGIELLPYISWSLKQNKYYCSEVMTQVHFGTIG
jgi:hypothetical protein